MDNTQINLPTRKPAKTSTDNLKGTAIFFVIVFLLACVVPGWAERLFTAASDTWHCLTTSCNPTGPAASWQDQLAAANARIATVGSDYAVSDVQFLPAAYKYDHRRNPWTPDNGLEVRVTYVMSNGLSYQVALWDTDPVTSVTLRSTGSLASKADYDKVAAAPLHLAAFSLGPRQAAERAWTAFRTQEGSIDLGLFEGMARDKEWFVSIQPVESNSATYVPAPNYGTYFLVNATTGDATMRNVFDIRDPLPPTPTPQP